MIGKTCRVACPQDFIAEMRFDIGNGKASKPREVFLPNSQARVVRTGERGDAVQALLAADGADGRVDQVQQQEWDCVLGGFGLDGKV